MVDIYLPAMGAFKDDVQTMASLLRDTVPSEYGIGLDIIGKPKHFKGKGIDTIVDNLLDLPRNVKLAIHGFSGGDVYEDGAADMRTKKGQELLKTYLDIAKAVNADYVHVHSAAGYKNLHRLSSTERERAHNEIISNFLSLSGLFPRQISLGLENLPSPSMGDAEVNPQKIWRDHVDCLDDCLYIVKDIPHGFITFDTCHYACNQTGGNVGSLVMASTLR